MCCGEGCIHIYLSVYNVKRFPVISIEPPYKIQTQEVFHSLVRHCLYATLHGKDAINRVPPDVYPSLKWIQRPYY